MKRTSALLLLALFTAPLLSAQDSAPESPGLDLIPSQAELPLIPDAAPESIRKPVQELRKKSKTAAADDAVQQRVRMRLAKTKALRDPAVQAEWERAEAAPTDYEKRAALKSYYRVLFGRMARIDRSLKEPIATSQKTALARLEQTRIAPTLPPASAR